MKHLIIIAAITLLFSCVNSNAQTGIVKEGRTFTAQVVQDTPADFPTDYLWKDKAGVEHTIYLHQYKKGDKAGQWTCYIVKYSKKKNKDYRQYLKEGPEIAAAILKEMKQTP